MTLQRYAIINTTTGLVENLVEYEIQPATPPDGMENNYIAVQSDTAVIGWAYSNGQILVPEIVASPLSWGQYQRQAMAALLADDIIATRCFKAGILYPAEWLARDVALRAIVRASSGDTTIPLPEEPKKPDGI